MSHRTVSTFNDLRSMDDEFANLTSAQGSKLFDACVEIARNYASTGEVQTAKQCYQLALKWGDDKANTPKLRSLGEVIVKAETKLTKEFNKLNHRAKESIVKKRFGDALKFLSDMVRINPNDNTLQQRIDEVKKRMAGSPKPTTPAPTTSIELGDVRSKVSEAAEVLRIYMWQQRSQGRGVRRLVFALNAMNSIVRKTLQ